MSDAPISTSDVKQEVKIRMGEQGQAAIPTKTVMQTFDAIVERLGDEKAFFQKRPKEVSLDLPSESKLESMNAH